MVAVKAVGGRSLDIFERKEYGLITCARGGAMEGASFKAGQLGGYGTEKLPLRVDFIHRVEFG